MMRKIKTGIAILGYLATPLCSIFKPIQHSIVIHHSMAMLPLQSSIVVRCLWTALHLPLRCCILHLQILFEGQHLFVRTSVIRNHAALLARLQRKVKRRRENKEKWIILMSPSKCFISLIWRILVMHGMIYFGFRCVLLVTEFLTSAVAAEKSRCLRLNSVKVLAPALGLNALPALPNPLVKRLSFIGHCMYKMSAEGYFVHWSYQLSIRMRGMLRVSKAAVYNVLNCPVNYELNSLLALEAYKQFH